MRKLLYANVVFAATAMGVAILLFWYAASRPRVNGDSVRKRIEQAAPAVPSPQIHAFSRAIAAADRALYRWRRVAASTALLAGFAFLWNVIWIREELARQKKR